MQKNEKEIKKNLFAAAVWDTTKWIGIYKENMRNSKLQVMYLFLKKKKREKKLFWPSSEYIHIGPDKLNQPLPGPLLSFSSHLSDFLFGWLGVNSYPRAMH